MAKTDYFAIPLTDEEFELFRAILETETGIVLKPTKRALLKNRLRPLLVSGGKTRYMDLLYGIREPTERFIVLSTIIDAITTNLTQFFREPHQFEVLEHRVLPELIDQLEDDPKLQVTIWSAGCSTGPEVYSIGMMVREVAPRLMQKRIRILATDIDSSALARARAGVYAEDELVGLTPERIQTHLLKRADGSYEVSEKLKEMVRFSSRNLITPDAWGPGGYHAIFCRNVLIYFSATQRKAVHRALLESLREGGYLFLGHAEGISGRDPALEYVCPSTYRRRSRGDVRG